MTKYEMAILKKLREGPAPATRFDRLPLERCSAEGLIEDVPWDERPHSKALRWVRLTEKGKSALAQAS